MKFLRLSFVLDAQLRARFFREIQLLQAVQHQNIVPVLDFGHQDDKLYLVMPLFEDQTLNDLLAKKQFSPLDAWGFVEPITNALTHLKIVNGQPRNEALTRSESTAIFLSGTQRRRLGLQPEFVSGPYRSSPNTAAPTKRQLTEA